MPSYVTGKEVLDAFLARIESQVSSWLPWGRHTGR
jgi:hypothetical protein